MRDVATIRQLINEYLAGTMARATSNRDVSLGGNQFFLLMLDKTIEHRKEDAKAAEEWLMTASAKPSQAMSKKDTDMLDKVKHFSLLGQVLPHHIEAPKKRGAVAYFKSIGVPF